MAYVALGSNLGDRERFLRTARERIGEIAGTRVAAASAVEETAPLGGPAQGAYLNQMLAVETDLEPAELLRALQAIENAAGRVRSERWGARTLDLDIVLFGERRVDAPSLRVPHPELPNREFWRRQLAELGVTP